jgi:hypothetical protein
MKPMKAAHKKGAAYFELWLGWSGLVEAFTSVKPVATQRRFSRASGISPFLFIS